MRTARTVDALGTRCPVPLRLLARAVSRRAPGDVVELMADDPLITVDLPAWCHARGHDLLAMDDRDGRWHCLVRCGPSPGRQSAPPSRAAPRS